MRSLVLRRFTATGTANGSGPSRSAAARLIEAAKAQLAPLSAGTSRPPRPSPLEVSNAVKSVTNGYLAWSLYVALRQSGTGISGENLEDLVGAMLTVDVEVHGDLAARRALSVLDEERQRRQGLSRRLLAHGASASALLGLPDLAESLCVEAELLHASRRHGKAPASAPAASGAGSVVDLPMRASLIEACGTAGQLERAFDEYLSLEVRTGRRPPGAAPVIALMKACVAVDDLDAGFDVFRRARESAEFEVRPSALVPLLRGCARQGALARATNVLQIADEHGLDVHSAAVREFARAGGAEFLSLALRLHAEARAAGKRMPMASTTKLARACLLAGDAGAAAEVLLGSPRAAEGATEPAAEDDAVGEGAGRPGQRSGGRTTHDLDSALDLLHSLARQEHHRELITPDEGDDVVERTVRTSVSSKRATPRYEF